jgi:hypothetical protein
MGVGQGINTIIQGQAQQKQMQALAAQANPNAPYQAQYAQQLAALQANPNSITSMPGYQAGLQANERALASQGMTGSGNAMAELQNYGGNFYQQQLSNLQGLMMAGNPATGASAQAQAAQYGQQSTTAGMTTALQGMAAMGYNPQQNSNNNNQYSWA